MAKVTSKLQVTIPRRLAEQCGISPGDEIDWSAAGDGIRITPAERATRERLPVETRLKLFDRATERQKRRQRRRPVAGTTSDRGWTREDLYMRGRTR